MIIIRMLKAYLAMMKEAWGWGPWARVVIIFGGWSQLALLALLSGWKEPSERWD